MALEYYAYVNNYIVQPPTPPKKVEEPNVLSLKMSTAKEITLAQYNPVTKDIITAHNLKDYRRKVFTLLLLPDADIIFDKVLEGSYYNEFLQHESLYS